MIQGFYHPCLTVSDLERAVDFYTDVIGMKIAWRHEGDSTAWQAVTGRHDVDIRVVFLEMEGRYLELMEYTRGAGRRAEYDLNDIRTAHVSFFSEDVFGTYEELKGKGVRFVAPPYAVESGEASFLFYDPDGNLLELCTPPETWRSTSP